MYVRMHVLLTYLLTLSLYTSYDIRYSHFVFLNSFFHLRIFNIQYTLIHTYIYLFTSHPLARLFSKIFTYNLYIIYSKSLRHTNTIYTILGPLLFVNDVRKVITDRTLSELFSDDTKV